MDKKVIVEVCCGSLDDAIEAQNAGADRIELNSSLFLGGLTPSIGTIIETKKVLNIPVMVMIRPRGGGFCYTKNEIKVMELDIKSALSYGADGIVFGALTNEGNIDEEVCKRFIEIIGDKEAVFHRAFDVTPNPFGSLDTLAKIGIKRILTKGQQNTFEEGKDLLEKLIKYAEGRIEILTAGCRPYNIEKIIKELKFDQVHIASFISKKDNSTIANPSIYFGGALRPAEDCYDLTSYSYVKNMREKIDNITANF